MPYFTVPLDAPQIARLRNTGGTVARQYAADQLVFLVPNTLVFSAQVNGAITGQPQAQIAYNNVTFGAYADIRIGQRLTISPTNNIQDRNAITLRNRLSPDATSLFPNEFSVDIADGSYIFVTNDYPLMPRLARPDPANPTTAQYKDFDLPFELLPPMVAGIQCSYVQRVDPLTGVATFALDASASFATDNTVYNANNLAFLWSFDDSGAVNVIGGGTTQANIEFEIDEGFQWGHLTITDDNGTETTFHFQIHPWGDVYTPVLGFDGASIIDDLQNGFGVSAVAFTAVGTVLDNTWMTIVRSPEYYNGEVGQLIEGDAYYVDFVGFLSTENSTGQADELYSFLPEVSFEVTGIGQRLSQIAMQAIGMRQNDNPTAWDEIAQLMPWRSIVHFWARHSTASTVIPLVFTTDVINTSYFYPYFATPLGGNLLSAANNILNSINAALEFWPNGTVEGVRDIRYKTELDRNSYLTLFDITISDFYDISIQYQHIPPVGKVYAEGALFNANSLQVVACKSIAPGTAQQIGADTGTLGQQILTEAGSQAEGQAELDQRAGNYFAILNDDGNTVTLSVPGSYDAIFYATRNILYTLTYDDTVRGISYTDATKFMCIGKSPQHNNESGARGPVQVVLQRLIPFAAPGDTIPQISDNDIAPAIPDLPPFPAFNSEFTEFSFPLEGLSLGSVDPLALDNPPSQAAKKDGSVLIISNATQAELLNNAIILTTPQSYEVTPPDLGDFEIQQPLFDPLNTGSNKPTANKYGYLLTSDGDNSNIRRAINIFARPPAWLTGDDITGLYNVTRGTNVDGGLMIYSPGENIEDIVVTFDAGGYTDYTIESGSITTGGNPGNCLQDGPSDPCVVRVRVNLPQISAVATARQDYKALDAGNLRVRFYLYDEDDNLLHSGDFLDNFPTGSWQTHDWASSFPSPVGGVAYAKFEVAASGFPTTRALDNATLIIGNGSSRIRYSSDRGETWGSEITVGDFINPVGGFDVSRDSGTSYAACAAKVRKATTLGGAYSDFLAFTGANPRAICIPYFRIGAYPTAKQTTASDPDSYVGLDAADSGGHSMYKCTGAAVKTGITPASGFIFEVANAITSSYGDEVAVIGLVGGDRRLYRSLNAGGAWTLEASSLPANTRFIRTRRGDNRRAKLGSGFGQGFLIKGLTGSYTVTWYDILASRNFPIDANSMDLLG